MKKMLDYHKN